ncbi:MAG: GNAT family N-acetyltransferase [Actinomycetota bacterium]|nr:GNAT family N-acetyltransferase [Actinomycetota bacterium]
MQSTIRRLLDTDVEAVVAFSLAAWAPVFASLEVELGSEVYRLLFPDWRSAQASAVETVCKAPENGVWVAVVGGRPIGFVAVRQVDEDATRAGEIYMLAVDPSYQRAGVGASLVHWAVAEIQAAGLGLVVVATGGDVGHAPARALYEKLNFNAFRQVRYYRQP